MPKLIYTKFQLDGISSPNFTKNNQKKNTKREEKKNKINYNIINIYISYASPFFCALPCFTSALPRFFINQYQLAPALPALPALPILKLRVGTR